MDPTTLTEHGCTWVRNAISDDGAGRELAKLFICDLEDEDWYAAVVRLADTYEDVLYDQAPCAAWHAGTGLVTACVRHIDRIDPRAAWPIAEARWLQDAHEEAQR